MKLSKIYDNYKALDGTSPIELKYSKISFEFMLRYNSECFQETYLHARMLYFKF